MSKKYVLSLGIFVLAVATFYAIKYDHNQQNIAAIPAKPQIKPAVGMQLTAKSRQLQATNSRHISSLSIPSSSEHDK